MKTNHRHSRKAQELRRAARKARAARLHPVSTIATDTYYHIELALQMSIDGPLRKNMRRLHVPLCADNLPPRAAMELFK